MSLTGKELREILKTTNVSMYQLSVWCGRSRGSAYLWTTRKKLWPSTTHLIVSSLLRRVRDLETEKALHGGKFTPRKFYAPPDLPPLDMDRLNIPSELRGMLVPPSGPTLQPYAPRPNSYDERDVYAEVELAMRERDAVARARPGLRGRWGESASYQQFDPQRMRVNDPLLRARR